MKRRVLVTALALWITYAASSDAAGIIINKSIGPFTLGMSNETVRSLVPNLKLGKGGGCGSTDTFFVCVNRFPDYNRSPMVLNHITTLDGEAARKRSRSLKTASGIGVGSTKQSFARAYPASRCFVQDASTGHITDFPARRILTRHLGPWNCKIAVMTRRANHRECRQTEFQFHDTKSNRVWGLLMSMTRMSPGARAADCVHYTNP